MRLAKVSFPDGSVSHAFATRGYWVRCSALSTDSTGDAFYLEFIHKLEKYESSLSLADVLVARDRGDAVLEESAKFHNPLPRAGKILAVGMNYLDHIAEMGAKPPAEPFVFGKYASSITGPSDEVEVDFGLVTELDYEVELGVVIGRYARDISVEHAMDIVAGYLVVNDLSSRNLQYSESQWIRSKSFDGFCPVGPWLTTAADVPNPQDLTLWSRVNGEQRQMSSTAQMLFPVAQLIAHCSRGTTLQPGDLLITGTPPGVAMGLPGKPWLKPGDVVECGVAGLGELRTRILGRSTS